VPVADGVPLIVIVLLAQDALTPGGKPLAPEIPAFDIPEAPVVVCVIFVNALPTSSVGLVDGTPAPHGFLTVMVPVAFTEIQLVPVSGIT
jgi:hypothetical protein